MYVFLHCSRAVWGSFLIAAAALKTPTRNGYNAQGVNLTFFSFFRALRTSPPHQVKANPLQCIYICMYVLFYINWFIKEATPT